ncbi:MAG: hypothetical protein Q7U44_02510 [Desulfuromonadales bacterium]|nr:hypothetical protein [Desulfuromonadales bacterium]
MRPFCLFLSFLCVLTLMACGTEDELTPPSFSNLIMRNSSDLDQVLTNPLTASNITITGNIDDSAATIVATTSAATEVPVIVASDGSWSFPYTPNEGTNIITFTASDERENINQLIFTVIRDTTPPVVVAVTQSQSVDPPSVQLLVTFNETLADLQPNAVFAVDGTSVTGATLDTVVTHTIFTLPLSAALLAGSHQLTCDGVVDVAGNSIAVGYVFDFTIE